MTLVPVRLYFKNGRVKVAVSLAKGKQEYDKRETIKTPRGRPRDPRGGQGTTGSGTVEDGDQDRRRQPPRPASRRSSRLPSSTDPDLRRPAPRHRGRLSLAGVRRRGQAARRRVSAHDQDDHRAARVFDARRRHCRHRRLQVDGTNRAEGDHLFRGRDDDCAVPRPRARQPLQAGRRDGAADRRRHQPPPRRWRRTSNMPGTSSCTCSRPRSSTRWRAATSCRSSCSRRSSASRWRRSARKGSRSSTCSRATAQVMFKVTGYVMVFAPIGVFAADRCDRRRQRARRSCSRSAS